MDKTITCLFIDDDLDDQEIFFLAMKLTSYQVTCRFAVDCSEAITGLVNKTIEVPEYIFIDWNMPLMNGRECLQALKKLPELRNAKIYILSELGILLKPEELKELGIKDVLEKKTSVTDLSDEFKRAIHH